MQYRLGHAKISHQSLHENDSAVAFFEAAEERWPGPCHGWYRWYANGQISGVVPVLPSSGYQFARRMGRRAARVQVCYQFYGSLSRLKAGN